MTNIYLIKFAANANSPKVYDPTVEERKRQRRKTQNAKIPWQAKFLNDYGSDILQIFGIHRGIEPYRFGDVNLNNKSNASPGDTQYLHKIRAREMAAQEPVFGDNGYLYRNLPTNAPLRRSSWLRF